MELYLRWLDRHERQKGEERPMAIILCAGKKRETVEYLDLGRSGIHVAEYLTDLPSKKDLARKLHEAVAIARGRLARGESAGAEPSGEAKRLGAAKAKKAGKKKRTKR